MKRTRYTIDLSGVGDAAAFHSRLRATLPLPDSYGDNLDAFYDVLTEFGAAWTLVFRGVPPPGVREVCEDAMAETPGLVVKFVLPRT